VFKGKANVRLLQIALPPGGATAWDKGQNLMDIKRIGSGLLMQTADNHEMALGDLKVVTKKQPTQQELQDLLFAWKVAKYVKSNAIVFCKDGMTMGVGAGQMSRLDSARIASIKAQHAGCRWPARRWRATRSSRSATDSTWWWMPGPPA
jgi:phosphoribosylaminoimidazolecarboxamide formyltransferase/IMP cyclohydrolase